MERVAEPYPVPTQIWSVVRETCREWSDDHASRLAASLAFYTLLSLAPLVVLVVLVAGLAYGEEAARGQIASELTQIVGSEGSVAIESIVRNARSPGSGLVGSAVGLLVLIFGASGVFFELRAAMNEIWDVAPQPNAPFVALLRQHLASFALVMLIAVLLLLSTLFSATLSVISRFGTELLPGGALAWQALNFAASLFVISGLFAVMYKYLPPDHPAWSHAWAGGAVAALLFVVGKSLIGLYLGKSSLATAFGAASSLVALLVWIYYSAQIIFFGAELTQVLSRRGETSEGATLPVHLRPKARN